MKRFILILLGILLLLSGLLYWRMKWVESRYEGDYITLENEILLPDTDGRGFSDKVKKEIDSLTKDSELIKEMYQVAKAKRQLVRSKSFNEYKELTFNLFNKNSCMLFSLNKEKGRLIKIAPDLKDIFYDNQEMKDYSEFLEFFKYNNRDFEYEFQDYFNKNRIRSQEDYDQKCN